MRKEKIHKIILAVCAITLLCFGLVGIEALQWHSQEKSATFSVASYDFQLLDDFVAQNNYAAGDVVSHSVSVQNTGTGGLYVRIKAVFESSDVESVCSLDLNTTDYVYEDGYYYLTSVLEAGDISPALFNTITIASDAVLADDFSPNMIVYAEVISQGNFADYSEAWASVA